MIRARLTARVPFGGPRGIVVWIGSVERGWTGKPVNPFKWNRTYSIRSAPEGGDRA